MNCNNCGSPIPDGSQFCTQCGAKIPEQSACEVAGQEPVCQNCGNPLPAGTAFCTRCGAKQDTAAAPTPAFHVCAACGASVREGLAFCTQCGTPVGQAIPIGTPKKRSQKPGLIIGIVAAVLACAALFFSLWWFTREKPDDFDDHGSYEETEDKTEPTPTETEPTKPAASEPTLPVETDPPAPTDPSFVNSDLEPATLYMWFHGSHCNDYEDVFAQINGILNEQLNLTIVPVFCDWGSFDTDVTSALQSGSGECDIVFTSSWTVNGYSRYSREGYYVKLDDLLNEYAPELLATLPAPLLDGSRISGIDGMGIYAVPCYKDYATQYCWDVNVSMLENCGYSYDDIKYGLDFYSDEFKDMLQAAKDSGCEYPLNANPAELARIVTHAVPVVDDVSYDLLSYFIDPWDPSCTPAGGNRVYSYYETPQFSKYAEKMREYYELGFIDPRMADSYYSYFDSPVSTSNYLFSTQPYYLGYEEDASAMRGVTVAYIPATAPFVDTASVQGAMMAVTAACQDPERAVMFLNLLNTDKTLYRLFSDGIEGVHYSTNSDGTLSWNDAHADYTPWQNGIGNITLRRPTVKEGADYWERFTAYYGSAAPVPELGFVAHLNDLMYVDYTAVYDLYTTYALPLMAGTVDPKTELPKLIEALRSAGINDIVDIANEQLALYLED